MTDTAPTKDRLLRLTEVLQIVPVASSTWRKWSTDGTAPAKVKRGGSTFWRESDVLAFVNDEWPPAQSHAMTP